MRLLQYPEVLTCFFVTHVIFLSLQLGQFTHNPHVQLKTSIPSKNDEQSIHPTHKQKSKGWIFIIIILAGILWWSVGTTVSLYSVFHLLHYMPYQGLTELQANKIFDDKLHLCLYLHLSQFSCQCCLWKFYCWTSQSSRLTLLGSI